MALVMPLALIAAACGGDDDDATATGDAGGTGGSDSDLTIDVTSPTDGAEVGTPFDVELDTSVEVGEPDTGLHHVHLFYDGQTADGDYDLVFGNSFTVERDLGPGEHSVEAVIANADHSLTEATDEITVNVTDAAGAGSGGSTDDTTATTEGSGTGGSDDDGGGYDYDT